MGILKKKALWFTLYGILITMIFLYLLFPSDIAKNRMEEAANSSGFILKTDSLSSSFPFGLKMKNVILSSGSSSNIYFQGDSLNLQFNPVSFFQKNKYIGLSGKAYGGKFSGRFGLTSFSKIYPPKEGKLKIEDINLGKYTFIRSWIGKELTGIVSGNWIFNNLSDRNFSGTFELFLKKGTYALAEPFLGLSRFDYNRCEIKAIIKNDSLKLEKMEILGPQLDCFLNGEITLAEDFKNSQLNLNGEMVIAGKKVKMNINIGGTLANPTIRYI
ncbi:MAG: type II secretion system protein GspN [Syntrophaceae bacterium]|nr:type II secretion system protein GspN [Syntrophaceae bacterium]